MLYVILTLFKRIAVFVLWLKSVVEFPKKLMRRFKNKFKSYSVKGH